MDKPLTQEELEEYNKIKDSQFGAAEEQAAVLCLEYYKAYRENLNISSDKIALAFKCAFYMAEKSTYSVNMKGQKVRGIAFSLNRLVKENKLDDTMVMLKDMTRKIKNIDEETSTYLNNVVKQISFLITLHSKFEKTFSQKLELKQRVNDGGQYTKLFTSYAWLLFIVVKNQVLKRSLQLLPNTCMIAHIISFMLIFAWDYVRPEGLLRSDRRITEKSSMRDIKIFIKQKILQIFCIKDINEYKDVASSFEDFNNRIMQSKAFRYNEDKFDFFSPENININYKKLDRYYEQNLNMEHLDERIFFQERALNLTPSKFTPFARQGYVNKHQKPTLGNKLGGPVMKPSREQTFNSHRVINYEAMQKQIQTKNIPVQDIKLPKNIIQSPSMVKVPLVMATPISTGMQMYNFLNEKKNKIPQNQRTLDKNILTYIERVFSIYRSENDKTSKNNKVDLIVSLYKLYYDSYLSANSYQKQSPELMRAFLGLSMELVFFVSNISLTFEKIEETLEIKPFQMWKSIDFFLKSDKNIPFPIKLHFLDLEVNFISFKIWQNMQILNKVSTFGNKSPKQMTQSQINFIDKLFKRTIHQIAFQITRLTNILDVDQQNSQNVFQTMKQIIINKPELLFKRHIDQLILCSIYPNCKGVINVKFNQIKECYINSNPNLKDIVEDIIVRVYMGQNQQPQDVIQFYNYVFLPLMKGFINNLRTNSCNNGGMTPSNLTTKKNAVLMSPLKNIIPKQINFKPKNNINNGNLNGRNKNANSNMTPQTQLLYAYSESPILKYESNNFKGPLKSKKIINFEQQDEKIKTKHNDQQFDMPSSRPTPSQNNIQAYSTVTVNSNSNYQTQATDFINKKYIRKATTPTNQHSNAPMTHATAGGGGIGLTLTSNMNNNNNDRGHQLHIPLQNITKQNLNPPITSNSHRTLFDDGVCNPGNNPKSEYQNGYKQQPYQQQQQQQQKHTHQHQLSQHQHSYHQEQGNNINTKSNNINKNKNYQFGAFRRE